MVNRRLELKQKQVCPPCLSVPRFSYFSMMIVRKIFFVFNKLMTDHFVVELRVSNASFCASVATARPRVSSGTAFSETAVTGSYAPTNRPANPKIIPNAIIVLLTVFIPYPFFKILAQKELTGAFTLALM